MNIRKCILFAAAAVVALGASGTAFAQCAANPNAVTLEMSGQGNLVCGNFAGPGGIAMENASLYADVVITPIPPKTIKWELTNITNPRATGDIVIVEAADGKRCVNHYLGDLTTDSGLTAPGNKNVKTVTICTDLELRQIALSPDTDPLPLSTGDGCEDNVPGLQTALNQGQAGLQVGFAIGTNTTPNGGNEQQLALCSKQLDGNSAQVQCVDRCETPLGFPQDVGPHSSLCTDGSVPALPQAFADGRFPIVCRRCATSGSTQIDYDGFSDHSPPTGPNIPENTPYCWELSHRVAVTGPSSNPSYGPELTFRPSNVVPGGSFAWERIDGTVCYKITGQTSGGYPYSYYVPKGCPCDKSVDPTCVNVSL